MKNFIKTHHRTIIAIVIFLVSYFVIYVICSDYIKFHEPIYLEYYNELDELRENIMIKESNAKIACFYLIAVQLSALIPSLVYMLLSYLNKKIIDK